MSSQVYDPEIKLFKFTPNTQFMRNNINNERIVRDVNSEGFLDENHSIEKPNGTYRIGIFGDSYVEATQVSIEKTFVKLIENGLKKNKTEAFLFGQSGRGTIHSYLISNKYTDYYNLDMVVYVFVGNDIGDQIESIKNASTLPYAELKNSRIIINDKKLSEKLSKKTVTDVLKKYFGFNKSILFQTIYKRLKLLYFYGVKVTASEDDFTMSGKGEIDSAPNSNDLPSTWNPKFKEQAISVAEVVISMWADEVKKSGREFVIIYVPHAGEWLKNEEDQDTWKSWLINYCNIKDIKIIDPTSELRKNNINNNIFGDHFTENGHIAFANAFIDWFNNIELTYK